MNLWHKDEAVSTAAVTEAFMAMDAVLTKAQAAMDTYHLVSTDRSLDPAWDAVRARYDDATAGFLSVTAPDAKVSDRLMEINIQRLHEVKAEIIAFQDQYDRQLNDAANQAIRLAAEAQRAREEAARRAAQLAQETQEALTTVSGRLEAVRTRLNEVGPAFSALLREFSIPNSADLSENQGMAQEHINSASDCLIEARTAQQRGDMEGSMSFVRKGRTELFEADRLISAVPERLQLVREVRDSPQPHSERVRFALRDAQKICVNNNLVRQWGPMLDAQKDQIVALEATLQASHPDYWGYANGLNRVSDSIQAAVTGMRQSLKR